MIYQNLVYAAKWSYSFHVRSENLCENKLSFAKNVAVSLFARSKLSQNKSSSDRVNTWKANTNIKNKAHISDLVIIVKIHFTGIWTSSAWNLVHKLTNSGMDVLITGNRLCFIEHCKKPGFLFIIIMWILNLQCATNASIC